MRTLVTGCAGFIGYHLCERLLANGDEIVGIDNLNPYYSVALKKARLHRLQRHERFEYQAMELADRTAIATLFQDAGCKRVIHLAAQAGVRHSLDHPHDYVDANVMGFLHILEGCRHQELPLVYASSSSVYGNNEKAPFQVSDRVDAPISLYAATKRAGELMAQCYTHLYKMQATGLRFFTVYGPWGRPDMAYFKFAEAIHEGRAIDVYNHGELMRDFTYVEDVVEGIVQVSRTMAPGHRIYNLGASQPTRLLDFIATLEQAMGTRAIRNLVAMQPGDVRGTWADTSALQRDTGYTPTTPLTDGLEAFVAWYRSEWPSIRADTSTA